MQNPASQLGVPLVVRGELVGVIVIESASSYRFHEEDKTTIELLGSYLAIAIQNMQLQESAEAASDAVHAAESVAPAPAPAPAESIPSEVAFHASDEVVMVDGEYLIRGLPAKILWKVLSIYQSEGRREFTNRELRLDKSLGLPDFKDNLETRLLLLRRRLDEKQTPVRLHHVGRGQLRLDLQGRPSIRHV